MKRFLTVFFMFSLFLCPLVASAAMINLNINYVRSNEKTTEAVDIKDGYWYFPVVNVPDVKEHENYSVVIEGYHAVEAKNEVVKIVGLGFSRQNLLLPIEGIITFENKENFGRKISIEKNGTSEVVDFFVQPNSVVQHSFSSDGDYIVTDVSYPWNKISVKVLNTSYLWTLKDGSNNRNIPDIAAGSYTLRIYYGIKWIYQEDFMVVPSATQNFIYKIDNGRVISLNTYSTSMD